MSQNPRDVLIANIEQKVSLYQKTQGANDANTLATVTMILDQMGQTILGQHDKIAELEMENANLKQKLENLKSESMADEEVSTSDGSLPDPTIE